MRLRAICLVAALLIAGCGGAQSPKFSDLPAGDAASGAALFTQSVNGAPACASCHNLDDTKLVGPGMAGYGARAVTRVEGQSAAEYTFNSIIRPAAYTVSGFGNVMYTRFGNKLNPQQIADLITYLLTL